MGLHPAVLDGGMTVIWSIEFSICPSARASFEGPAAGKLGLFHPAPPAMMGIGGVCPASQSNCLNSSALDSKSSLAQATLTAPTRRSARAVCVPLRACAEPSSAGAALLLMLQRRRSAGVHSRQERRRRRRSEHVGRLRRDKRAADEKSDDG